MRIVNKNPSRSAGWRGFLRGILYLAASGALFASCGGGDAKAPSSDSTAHAGDSSAMKSELKMLAAPAHDSDVAIAMPDGFRAAVFASGLGKTRHIAVTPDGTVYVKLRTLRDGKGILVLKDNNGDGQADQLQAFGDFPGTGIAQQGGYLYATTDEDVYRFRLNADGSVGSPEKIVTGLIARNEHEPKTIALDGNGNVYVNIGAFSNSCQIEDRKVGSLGRKPCPVLDSAAGIWQFAAGKPNQQYADGKRYATGLRNCVAIDWNTATNSLFVAQHGRDQLNTIFPKLYSAKQNAELPAECLYELHDGSNCGWPYIYYDEFQNKKILAPEYGGDGKKAGDDKFQDPTVAFPGHLAPDGLLFYHGTQFPEKYRDGAFIAFHGSWNRAPEPQKGYFVAFVPFKGNQPTGKWEIFANGFAGDPAKAAKGDAKHRPCGLAEGPDGSIYVTDDEAGTVWKISYKK